MKKSDHEWIIDYAFGSKGIGPHHLSDWDRRTLKRASADVDSIWRGQTRLGSFRHAMRGWGQPTKEAVGIAILFVQNRLQYAADLQRGGSHDLALYHLGEGMHTIADSFSTEHEGAQRWCGDFFPQVWCIPSDLKHAVVENSSNTLDTKKDAAVALTRYYSAFFEMSGLAP